MKLERNNWCTEDFGWKELQRRFPEYRLLRRFVITQASGKKRVIDDAASGGQSFWSRDANRLQFWSALQPCAHIQALAQAYAYQGMEKLPLPVSASGPVAKISRMHIARFQCWKSTAVPAS